MNLKLFFTYLGGFIAFGILVWYARKVWVRKVPASTAASFLMWMILDSLLLVTTLANHQPGLLPGGWATGAAAVTIALFGRGKWSWSYKETICAVGAAITGYVWLHYGAVDGLWAGIAAMNLAGLPLWIDLWCDPIRGTWPLWGFTVVACISTLLGSDWSFTGSGLAGSSLIYNASLTAVVLFRKTRAVREKELLEKRSLEKQLLEKKLLEVRRRIAEILRETGQYLTLVEEIHANAVDKGSLYEMHRHAERNKKVALNLDLIKRLRGEEALLEKMLEAA